MPDADTFDSLRAEYEPQLTPIEDEMLAATRPVHDKHRAELDVFHAEIDRRRAEIHARHRMELDAVYEPFRARYAAIRAEWEKRANALRATRNEDTNRSRG